MPKPESQKTRPDKPTQIYIRGSIPCVICWEDVTQENISRGDVILNMVRYVYPAHIRHFYNPVTWTQTADYERNMNLFSLATGIGEGWDLPYLPIPLRSVYEEMKEKMKGWNHPALVHRESNN